MGKLSNEKQSLPIVKNTLWEKVAKGIWNDKHIFYSYKLHLVFIKRLAHNDIKWREFSKNITIQIKAFLTITLLTIFYFTVRTVVDFIR